MHTSGAVRVPLGTGRRAVRALGICLTALALLCTIGGLWNGIATNAEKKKYPPMGQMVDGFDGKLHVFHSGEAKAGQPTIVLLSGWGTTSPTVDFYPLWSRLDRDACVVVLERPGYGWSEPTSRARTVDNFVEEDRQALTNAGFKPPYLLVAHSMGGLEAAYYAGTHREEVSGVVLIDSMAPEITLRAPGSISMMDRIVPAAKAIGLLRFINLVAPGVIDSTYAKQNHYVFVDSALKPAERALTLRNAQDAMMSKEWQMMPANARTVQAQGLPKDLPLLCILSDATKDDPRHAQMLELQQAWVGQTAKGRIITLHGAHYLHQFDPDGICAAIGQMMDDLKKESSAAR